jgi:hypothetical protein
MTYFPLLYRLNSEDRYLIWIGNDGDSVLVDGEGFVPTFKDLSALRRYAKLHRYSLETEKPRRHDLQSVAKWIKSPIRPVNCKKALAAWNLFVDVARSVGKAGTALMRLDSRRGRIYEKVFRGNNLPAVTPEGCHYIPEWSSDETAYLIKIFACGLKLFEACTRSWAPE